MVRLRLRIRLPYRVTRQVLLVLALLLVILLNTTILYRARATAPDSPSTPSATSGVRQFYLSLSYVQANEASSACADGYHFASIWEIADPSSLRYNTTLGVSSSDSGEGPPSATIGRGGEPVLAHGWVRTGYKAWSSDTAGQANCTAWGTSSELAWGTVANLPADWTGGEQDIGIWNTEVRTCDASNRVWCVQDDSVWRVYLPVVLK